MDKRFLIIVAAIIVVVGGIFWFSRPSKSTPGSNGAQPSNHVMGGGSKNVTLVEYGDFQCPACGAYYPVVKQVVSSYQDQIFFQFRNFPLTQIHQNAFAGARAAEAAAKQNKYWEMHDKLYEGQQDWTGSSNPFNIFKGYATDLKLDTNKFQSDYQSQAVNDVINADIAVGQKIPVTATPTFILDGVKVENNPQSVDAFMKLIQDAIVKKNPGDSGAPTSAAPASSTDASGAPLPAATPAGGQ